ncbi:MAG: peptidyl-prolyl cis-trans isomerase [Candidatus Babeliales bacterium]
MDTMAKNLVKGSALLASLMLATGCDILKKKESLEPRAETASKSGITLCSINGESAVTEGEYKNNLHQMLQSNPYFKGASAESLPNELKRRFLEQLAMQSVIEKFSDKNGIENDPEFIKIFNELKDQVKRSIKVQLFEKRIYDGIKVADADITKYYNDNKERFVKVAGGVLAMGSRFDSEAQANAFLAQAKHNIEGFEKLAKADKAGKFRDFGRVSKEARGGFQMEVVPAPVKETVLGLTKLPSVEKIKVGKEFWVVKAWDKKDTVIFGVDEVKTHIEAMLKNNQFKDVIEKRMEELKKEMKVVINEDYFKDTKAAPAPESKGNQDTHVASNDKQATPAGATAA